MKPGTLFSMVCLIFGVVYGQTCGGCTRLPCNGDLPCVTYNSTRYRSINVFQSTHNLSGVCSQCLPYFWGENCSACGFCFGECFSNGTCDTCDLGYWGPNCATPCGPRCLECDQQSGDCTKCEIGFWDEFCGSNCSSSCKITSTYGCNISDGGCDVCNSGVWNLPFCDTNCSKKCTSGVCYAVNGSCSKGCVKGYWGDNCNQTCPANCFCNETGDCVSCAPNHWGTTCTNICLNPNCGTCDQNTGGNCTKCYGDTYGVSCNTTGCTVTCDNTCSKECRLCDTTAGCICNSTHWGNSCQNICNSNCVKKCNDTDGTCSSCAVGFWGLHCNKTCVSGL